jgi:hypothetical protein
MALNDTAKNLMLDALIVVTDYVSAHDADPGATGINELASGNYAREAITFSAAAAGAVDSSNQPVIGITSGDTVTHLGLWSAVTVGTFYGSADVTDEGPYGANGTYTVTDFDISIT